MYRSAPVYGGGEGEHYFVPEGDCTSEEYDPDSEDGKGARSVRRSLSLEIYGLQREPHVHFSNREYYRRLEELKSAHLRNMAELETMYIGQGRERRAEEDEGRPGGRPSREDRLSISSSSSPARKLQRINSQEELDFHDTSSGSDQSELLGELEPDHPRGTPVDQDQTFERDFLLSPEETATREEFRFQPKASCPKRRGSPSRPTGVRVKSSFKATVPKPFQMMLREEERKRRKVRTRSEIELENALLRRELEELQECQKTFRAAPAPAHIHLPLYEVISRRLDRSRSSGGGAPPRPFRFLERERRKREAKVVAELGKLQAPEEEERRRRAFRARPMPSSVYGARRGAHAETSGRQAGRGPGPDASTDSRRPRRCPSAKPAKKQIELSIEMVKEREWCYTDI
ncbi:protein FAM161A-like [Cyclopterus lumpus]|uniref:protein FAM161A-like n=1 Tax=Cyclopterus lumpus TaxID=8103 RepID=UPI0014864168|nr:protein FAM161A-like [Cyclopterus lumpus]